MAQQRLARAQPLGAGGADIVLAQRLDQGRAQHARQDRGLRQGQRDAGQDQRPQRGQRMIPAREAARRQPAQVHRKDQDQQHREPEVRQRDADLRPGHQRRVGDPAVTGGRQGSDGKGDRHRQCQRHQRQGQRDLHPFQDHAAHRRLVGQALAQVAGQDAAQPARVAQRPGQVQAHLLAQRGQGVGLRAGAQHEAGRIPRHQRHHAENRRRGHSKAEAQHDQAADQIAAHGGRLDVRPCRVKRAAVFQGSSSLPISGRSSPGSTLWRSIMRWTCGGSGPRCSRCRSS